MINWAAEKKNSFPLALLVAKLNSIFDDSQHQQTQHFLNAHYLKTDLLVTSPVRTHERAWVVNGPSINSESHSVVSKFFATPWTIACQAPLSMEFSRQEYWSGLPFPSPGDLPDPGIEPRSPALQADSLPSEPPRNPNKFPNPNWVPLKEFWFKEFPLLL